MDLNLLWETLKPYITDTAVVGSVLGIVIAAVKMYNTIVKKSGNVERQVDLSVEKMEKTMKNMSDVVAKALPDTMTIDVSSLVKTELKKYVAGFEKLIDKDVLENINTLTDKCDLILRSLSCLKSIPDSLKTEIAAQLHEEVENKVVVELTPQVTEEEKEEVEESVEIPIQ